MKSKVFEFLDYWRKYYSDLDLAEGTPEFSAAMLCLESGKSAENTATEIAVRFWQAPPLKTKRSDRIRSHKHHILKTWPEPFQAIAEKRKLFELRLDDRDFQEGDSAELREWDPETKSFTSRWIFCKIGYVMKEPFGFPGIKPGYCVWTIILPANHVIPEKYDPASHSERQTLT